MDKNIIESYDFLMRTLLVDTSYLIYRSYFAYPHLNQGDTPTGALFGFIKTVISVCKHYSIDKLVFALDLPGKTWRHEKYEAYKAGRLEMEDAMRIQIPLVIEWAKMVTSSVYSQEGYEADDIIFSYVCSQPHETLYIMSSDRDLYQTFSYADVQFLKPKSGGGYTEYTTKHFSEDYGIDPRQYIDYKALVGDSSDNLAGVEGIGPKTASKILQAIGSLKHISKEIGCDEDTFTDTGVMPKNPQWQEESKNKILIAKIRNSIQHLIQSYELAKLHKIHLDISSSPIAFDVALPLYEKYNFRSIMKEYTKIKQKNTIQTHTDALF